MIAPRLRLAFAGTPEIASRVLSAVLKRNEHYVELVFTCPDRLSGRGRKLRVSEVKSCSLKHGIQVKQPSTSTAIDDQELAGFDLMLVVAYGILLTPEVLHAPRLGCINIHTSLLPRWRGAAPIQRAIEAGDTVSGISIMQMNEGLDTGPLLLQQKCQILPDDTAGKLHDRLAQLCAESIHLSINQLAKGQAIANPQDDTQACYAGKITKAEAKISWHESAVALERKIRAFNPSPVAYTCLNGLQMRIWQATIKPHVTGPPGTIIDQTEDSIDVITGDGVLAIKKLQLPGKRIINTRDFLNGHQNFIA